MPFTSAGSPSRSRSRTAAGLPAVTAERLTCAAMQLTIAHGLDNWTVRQLAAAVDAYPAVVYHHVGDREAVVKAVVEQVVAKVPLHDADLPWREWFSRMLTDMRGLFRHYPGSARRVQSFGLSIESSVKFIDRGVQILQGAGFGAESPLVYNVLTSTACQFITMEDDHDADQNARVESAAKFGRYQERADLPGASAMASEASENSEDAEQVRRYYGEMYDYAVSRCLDGLAARLTVIKTNSSVG
jgi:AcrR family transcriptional regulator